MFDDLIREVRRLSRSPLRVSVSLPQDEHGYLDRECPADECHFQFKVLAEDWKGIVRDEEVFCPRCGHSAEATQWNTKAQEKRIEAAALGALDRRLHGAMRRDADSWNRKQRGGLIQITMEVKGRPTLQLLPSAVTEPMQLKITCERCSCRFAVIGAAFFCPSCGESAAEHVFRQSLSIFRRTIEALPDIRSLLPDRDAAENTVRLLLEDGLENMVTAFQRYAEALYAWLPAAPKPRRNAFQSLSDGDALWRAATLNGYDAHLADAELASLGRYFQQRHLLAHCEGIVDESYVVRSGDFTYRIGQRIVVREQHALELLDLVGKLAAGLARDAAAARGGAVHP